jgi:hypothetical protein
VDQGTRWRRVFWAYSAACLLLATFAVVLIAGLDPYDTGRFALFGEYGVPGFGQRLTAASVAREPDAEAAILGNSTMQLMSPVRLSELTHWRFVSLAMPFAGPPEQMATMRWLVRHHDGYGGPALKGLVIGLDSTWCEDDGKLDMPKPFPFWLYGDSRLDYLWSLMNMRGFNAVVHKLRLMLGAERPLRRDGYHDFEPEIAMSEAAAALDFDKGSPPVAASGTGNFAAVPLLRDFLPTVPPTTAVVLVFVPHYYIDLPIPGSSAAQELATCKAKFHELAANRPNTTVLDFRVDGDIARDRRNFWDRNHYRMPIARYLEKQIAVAFGDENGS